MRLALLLSCAHFVLADSVTQSQYDNSNSSSNTNELMLTQALVSSKFGILARLPHAGIVWSQPLITTVTISGAAQTLIIAATSTNDVYAWRTDTYELIWHRPPLDTVGDTANNRPATVIDPATNLLYVYTQSATEIKLWCLNVTDGTNAASPVTVSATVGMRTFDATQQKVHGGLRIANGNVYFACGSLNDDPEANDFQGWVFAYNKTTLAFVAAFISTTGTGGAYSDGGGGIWQAGVGPAIRANGNLLYQTGNGAWDGTANFGETALQLTPSLSLSDWFTPSNWSALNDTDFDLGSGHAVLLSDTRAVVVGKDTKLFLLNLTDMGHLQGGGGTSPIQVISPLGSGVFVGLAYANSDLFVSVTARGGIRRSIDRYHFNGSTLSSTPDAQSSVVVGSEGAALTYSSNQDAAGSHILWANTVTAASSPRAVLQAFRPSDMVKLWDSDAFVSDRLGAYIQWAFPTVINGKVFIASGDGCIRVYGIQYNAGLSNGLPLGGGLAH